MLQTGIRNKKRQKSEKNPKNRRKPKSPKKQTPQHGSPKVRKKNAGA
jgi:hypothetical protein